MKNFFKRDITAYVVIVFILLVLISIFLKLNKPITVTLTTSDNPIVNEPVVVGIEVEKHMSHYTPDTFTIELTHKYNSNDTTTFDLAPYENGLYEFIFTPSYSGPYLLKFTIVDDGSKQYETKTLTIEQ